MKSLHLKNKETFSIFNILYGLIPLALITVSYLDSSYSKLLSIIIRCSLSVLTIMIIANRSEDRSNDKHLYIIGIGYITSNIFDVISLLYFNLASLVKTASIIANILEVIACLYAVELLSNTKKSNNAKIYIKGFVLFVFMLILLILDKDIFKNSTLNLYTSEIVIILNLIVIMYTIFKYKEQVKYKEKKIMKLINRILYIKVLYFGYLLLSCFTYLDYSLTRVVIEMSSILQVYLVYKIIIRTSIINPYVEIKRVNDEINMKSKEYERTNKVLKELNESKSEINKNIVYRDDFFNSILESTPNGFGIFDDNLDLVYTNKVFKNIIDYNKDIISSLENSILNYNQFIRSISDVCKDKISRRNDISTYDGYTYKCTYKYCEKNNGCICILIDITNEKSMLNSLVNLKEEYEDLIINIKRPVFICDDNNKIIKKSKFYEKTFGNEILYFFDESYNTVVSGVDKYNIYPDDIEKCKYVKNINKKAQTNEETYNHGFFRYRVINKNNDIRWLESNTTIDYKGDEKYTIIAYSDITEYVKAEEYLERTQNMYKELLDSIPEGIYLEDLETKEYMFINKKFMKIFNIDEDIDKDNLGICRKDLMSIHPEYEHVIKDSIEMIKENKIADYVHVKYFDKDNKIIDAQVASIPFRIGNKALKLTIIKDMLDIQYLRKIKKKLLESKKHDQLKMKFFINMSHELKTPLNLIFTSTQLLENLYNKNKVSSSKNYLEKHIILTKQNSFRLIKIINDLIDFTKMESGFYKIRMENHDIISTIEDITMSVVTYAQSKDINLVFDTDIEELIISIDINAIERIILNILSNAIKFTDNGGNVYVNIYKRDDNLDIVIEDTGIGIPKDKINAIFDRFNDVNKGFIGNIYGSGIGLSMVKSVCNLINATVNVESEFGKGTKFTVTLAINTHEEKYDNTEEIDEKTMSVERLIVDMADIYK